jgi:hypothetical protein
LSTSSPGSTSHSIRTQSPTSPISPNNQSDNAPVSPPKMAPVR